MPSRVSTRLMLTVGISAAVVTGIAAMLVMQSYSRLALADALPAVPPGPRPDHRSFGPRPFAGERRVRPQAP